MNEDKPMNQEEINQLYSKMALEIMEQMKKGKDLSSLINRDNIKSLIDKIKQDESNYYLCHIDLKKGNEMVIANFTNQEKIVYEKIKKEIIEKCDFDVIFYKIGEKCNGWKKRFAIIVKGGFFSSTKPLKYFEKEKSKDKTKYLYNSVMSLEKEEKKNSPEWHEPTLKYRMIIEYDPNKSVNKEKSGKKKYFIFYFINEEKRDIVRGLLFGGNNKDEIIINNVNNMISSIERSFTFYGILKMLSVKNKIKKRKNLLNELKNYSDKNLNGLINFGKNTFHNNLREKYLKKIERFKQINQKKLNYLPSDFLPIITSLPFSSQITSNDTEDFNLEGEEGFLKTTNEMKKRIEQLKNSFPNNFNRKVKKCENIGFSINEGVEIEGNNFIDPNKVNKSNLICVNRDQHEIIFKEDDDNFEVLKPKNIYDISNVIANSNKEVNEKEDNNLIILGPKIDQNKIFEYGYSNEPSTDYIDPEAINLKYNNSNIPNDNRQLICLQIFQLKYEMPFEKLNEIVNDAFKQNININKNNPEEDFYFYHIVDIGNKKRKKSNLVKAKQYKNDHFIVEFNKQYFFLLEDVENKIIKVECYCIPCKCFDDKMNEDQKYFLVDYMKPYNLGESEISYKSIKEQQYEYPLDKNNIKLPESTKIIVFGFQEYSKENPTIGLKGKDYSIGDDMYLVKQLNKNDIQNASLKSDLPDELKEKYYNIEYDGNDILYRPPENMSSEDFKKEINVSPTILNKINYNKRFIFLPQCEKTEEGNWIYKSPQIKVRTLSKNLGVDKNSNINQFNYFSNEEEKLYKKVLYDNQITFPITENNFNLLDMKNLDHSKLKNFDNHQWKLSIKFNNEDQMNTFIKVLQSLRQKVNLDYENNYPDDVDYKRTLENLGKFDGNKSLINLGIRHIFFRDDYYLPFNSFLKFSIEKGRAKTLLELLEYEDYEFKNSILEIDEVKEKLNGIKNRKFDLIPISGQSNIKQSKFNSGNHLYSFKNKLIQTVPVSQTIDSQINFNIKFENNRDENKCEEFFAPINLIETFSSKAAIGVWPIYKKIINKYGESVYEDKIYGLIKTDSWIPVPNKSFDELFFEEKEEYLKKGNFKSKDDMKLSLGKYEPNVFRRKIIQRIYEKFHLSPYNLMIKMKDDHELEKEFNDYLNKKCVLYNNLNDINFEDIRKNISNDINTNSFQKRFGIKSLHYLKLEDFYLEFSKSEWKRFLKEISKNKESLNDNLDDLFDELPENREEVFNNSDLSKKLSSVIYLGIPTTKGRSKVWEFLLDIPKIYNETKEAKNDFENLTNEDIYDEYKKRNDEINIVYSLIDNDINFLYKQEEKDIDVIKNITKAFFRWTEDGINIQSKKNENTKYVYFSGILSIVQTIFDFFKDEAKTFWFLIGLSQCIDLFQQENPLYSENMSYMNIYILVVKLIIENHYNDIYQKFLSLNFPIETLISHNIGSFFCDYFKGSTILRILDILIFEASFKGHFGDKLQYLRILCTIPITLIHFKRKNILNCESVSELKTIFEDMIIGSYDTSRFMAKLRSNVQKFFVCENIFQKWFGLNENTKWDNKRDTIEKQIYYFFNPIRNENKKYLKIFEDKPNQKIIPTDTLTFIETFQGNVIEKLETIRRLYAQGTPFGNDPDSKLHGISFSINKLKPLFGNNNDEIKENLKLNITFNQTQTIDVDKAVYWKEGKNITMNLNDLSIINQNELFFDVEFPNDICHQIFPNYLIIVISSEYNKPICYFSLHISKFEIMKIDKLVLESINDERKKFILEMTLFRYSKTPISSDDISLFNALFDPPLYNHNNKIEEEIFSYKINTGRDFTNSVKNSIYEENNLKQQLIEELYLDDRNDALEKEFLKNNKICDKPDNYNNINEKIIKINSKDDLNKLITSRVEEILSKSFERNEEIGDKENENYSVVSYILEWLKDTNNSLEEILYCFILIDKSSFTISEKLYLLFSIGQTKNFVIFNDENKITVEKVKEMIYILYKRYLIYFTKNDINRMVDFYLKDERLFNLKYVFIYDSTNENRMNQILYDTDRIGTLNEEFFYDNLNTKFNSYINYFINHYNMKSIPQSIVKQILTTIIKESEYDKYKQKQLDKISLVVVRDNLQYIHNYKVYYNKLRVEEGDSYIINLNDKNEIIDKVLINETNNLEITNTYSEKFEISFQEFKNFFFKLPFISELLRISCSYVHQTKCLSDEKMKIKVQIIENDNVNDVKRTFLVNQSNTMEELMNEMAGNNFVFLKNPSLYNYYVVNTDTNLNEKILYFDPFYSNLFLKKNNQGTIKIVYNKEEISIIDQKFIEKKEGYCKRFIDNNSNFEWRKAKINEFNKVPTLISVDFISKPILNSDDIIFNLDELEKKNRIYKKYEKKEVKDHKKIISIKEEEPIQEIKSIYINYINKKFPINILNYNSIEDLKKEIKNIFHLIDINNDQMILFFEKINLIENIEIENNEDLENIKKEKEGNLILKIRISDNKQETNLIRQKIEFENEINESEKIKNIILKDKKYNKKKLIETQKVLKENYLFFKKYNNNNNFEENDEEMKKEQDSILCLLSNVLESKGIETAVYKDNQTKVPNGSIQKICSGLSDKKKYTFHFDFGEEKNKDIMNDMNKFNQFTKEYKEKIAKKLNINPDNIIITNPRKGSVKIDVFFITPGVFDESVLEAKFKDCKELVKIHREVLMQGCQLDRSLFDQRGNNKDGGWGIGEYRGGEEYIPPEGWIGYGLNVMGKYDNGNDDWLSYTHPENEYAVAYYPIKDFLQNSEDMKNLIKSVTKSTDNQNISYFNYDDWFQNEKNVNKRSNNNYKKCGTGTFLFQDIKLAEANSSEVNVGGAKYKILFMCRVKPDEIKVPENFPSLWILNSDSKSIRQYRILIKIEKNDIPITSGTLTLFKQPKTYYKNIMMNKNTSFYTSSKIANLDFKNNSEKVIYLYTTNQYTFINNYLRTGKNYSNYTEDELKSWTWCLHSALTNYQGDKNKIGIVDDNTVVYRGCQIGFDENKYPVGSQFYFGEFISTSKKKEVAECFGGDKNLMVITIKNNKKKNYCYYVKNISKYQPEEEVIITAFCNFLISKYENKSGQSIIYLICLGYVLDENKANEWPSLS